MSEGVHHGVGAIVTTAAHARFFVQQKDESYPRFPLAYSLFGGGLEPGETPAQALIRELHEELGDLAQPLLAAGPRCVLSTTVEPGGFVYSLFEIEVEASLLDTLADAPVLEGKRGAVIERDALRRLPFIWGLEAVIHAYLDDVPVSG